jgi:arabinofuranosyltransferase
MLIDTRTWNTDKRIFLSVSLFIFVLFALAFANTAWVCEDAYITFRVVDNALNGYGLVWNPGERVQVYTHPLWFFLLLAGSAFYNDPYYISVILSFLCLGATVFLALKILRPCGILSLLVFSCLLFSRAFIDYISSGLENPLNHALIALFLWVWFEKRAHRHFLFFLVLIAAVMFLNRPDSIVLVFPALLYCFWNDKNILRRKIGIALAALSPVVAWEIFSVVYYGSPVPNTALAKAATGIGWRQYAEQSWYYFQYTFKTDIATIILMAAGIFAGFLSPSLRWKAISSGIVFWGIYLCAVGGDYMGGRFFSASVLFAAILCARASQRAAQIPSSILAMPVDQGFLKYVVLGLMLLAASQLRQTVLEHTVFSPLTYHDPSPFFTYSITNSRAIYYRRTGLRHVVKNEGGGIRHHWFATGQKIRNTYQPGESKFYIGGTMGIMPYAAGPDFHWIDFLVLTDSFRARLPYRQAKVRRPGHYERDIPYGYLESVLTGTNRIQDPALARLYDDVVLATTGDIFRWERFAAIFRLNTGFHKDAAKNFSGEKLKNKFLNIGQNKVRAWRIDSPQDFAPIKTVKVPVD